MSRPPSARRAAIVDATVRVIAQVGAGGVTHRAVASEAGVPLASTTYYFDSKDALVVEAFERVIARSVALVERHATAGTGSLVDRLVDLVLDQLADEGAPLTAQLELLIEAGRRPALRPLAERWDVAYMDAMTRVVAAAGVAEAAQLAAVLTALMEGALLSQLAVPVEDFAATTLRPLLSRVISA